MINIVEEKKRQKGYRRDLEETMSMTLPRSGSKGKKKLAPDSLSLVNEPGTLTQGPLTRNNPLSSSLTDLNQTGKYCQAVPLHDCPLAVRILEL